MRKILLAAALAFLAPPGFAQSPAPAALPVDSETPTATAPAKPDEPKKPRTVKIEMRDGMRFEPPRFEAKPGEEIIISLENADSTHQPHNFLILQPGKREAIVQEALTLGEKGPAQDFIPASPDILVHSALVNPEGTSTVHFTMPAEKGIYPYVCSMPGHGMLMYGAIYSGVKMPSLAKDKNLPPQTAQAAMPGGGQRPYVQRIFMPKAGPAAIAVALPGEQNFCWDAGECRLRYAWRGAFIDASANWRGSGRDLPIVPAEPWWTAEKDAFPLKLPGTSGPAQVKFLGYRMEDGLPEFHYRVGAAEVFEKITATPNDTGIALHFHTPKAAQAILFSLAPGQAGIGTTAGPLRGGSISLTAMQAADFTVTLTEPPSTAATPKP